MPSWYVSSTLYKGLFLIVVLLIAFEYFFGTIETRRWEFFSYNTSRSPVGEGSVQNIHSPLIKSLLQSKTHNNSGNSNELENKNSTNDPSNNKTIVNKLTTELNLIESTFNNTTVTDYVSATDKDIEKMTISYVTTPIPVCPDVPPNLIGRQKVIKSPVPSVMELEKRFDWLDIGGHWKPNDCKVTEKVALIVPFRCRGEHLLLFLQHMHPFLKRQQLDYRIFVVEQDGNDTFNRAMLMNVGYAEAAKLNNYDCYIFHDVDLLPEDDHNMYTCPEQPRHMSVAVDEFKYRLPYPSIFGGVSAINTEQFKELNGFSNMYWGWGGEDDDMSNRIKYHNFHISRYPATIARYTMLIHKKDTPNPKRYDLLKNGQKHYATDGLNSLKYKLIQMKENLLYTWFLVALNHTTAS